MSGTLKSKILMHYVMPGATGGPNILFNRIEEAPLLKEKYSFIRLNQNRVAGGKINITLIMELKREIMKVKPDIIHISGMQSAGFHCMMAAVLAGCKNRLITTHGFSGDALNIPFIKKIVFNKVVEPITLMCATHVHCISMYTNRKKMIEKYAKNKKTCIYNFPPIEKALDRNSCIREELGIRNEEVVFTAVSRIVLDKGYKQLAEAIHKIRTIENIRFLIIGDGNYENSFKEQLSSEIENRKVIMLGKQHDVMKILNESDVFILPTLHENLGNVFLEASAAGIPSIGTMVGGVPEVIIDGDTGLLVPPYNSDKLIGAIKKLYTNYNLRKKMGKRAKERLGTFFSFDFIEKQFDKLYSSMIAGENNN